ncbi:MAG: CBS domain-containing protein [Chitinophagia bacterium]|nr:CBS domain-containing protein [Chitinophagia bacterium]
MQNNIMPLPPCRDVMTRNLKCVPEYEQLSTVVKLFEENGFHHAPVLNKDGHLSGIISLTDIDKIRMSASIFKNETQEEYNEALFESLFAKAVMTRNVVQLHPSESIEHAHRIFKENKFRAIPIVEGDQLVGLITPLDLLDYFFNQN